MMPIRARARGEMKRGIVSTLVMRAKRSNPESFRGGSLDCFAALAMTTKKARAAVGVGRAAARANRGVRGTPLSSGVSEQGLTPVEHEQDQGEHDQDQACGHFQLC